MKKQLLTCSEQLALEQKTVDEFINIYSLSLDFSTVIYSEWTAKDVLGHVTYWHLGFARNITEAANNRGQNPFKGSLSEVNERGIKEMSGYTIAELISKLREAQNTINELIENKNIELIEYKKGSRPYTAIEHLEVTRRHVAWHIKDMKEKFALK
jgi:hypothetical protein